MNAGEAVYQGREGTGLAQILNWKEYRSTQQRLPDPFKVRQAQLAEIKFKEDAITKAKAGREDGTPFFAPQIGRFNDAYMDRWTAAFDETGNPGVASRRTTEQLNQVKELANKTKAAAAAEKEIEASVKSNKYSDPEWVNTRVRSKIYPMTNGEGDATKIDTEGAMQSVSHARNYNWEGKLSDDISDYKTAIKSGVVSDEMKNTEFGKNFVIKNGQARFGYIDEKTGEVIPFISEGLINDALDDNGKTSDRIRWNVALEELQKTDPSLNEITDHDAIEERFLQIRNDPKYAPQVREQVKEKFENANQFFARDDIRSAGRYPTDNGYGKPPIPKLQISDARTIKSAQSLSEIDPDGELQDVMDAEGSAVDLQGVGEKYKSFKEIFTFNNKSGNPVTGKLLELGPNKKGQKTLFLREDKAYNQYDVREVPFTNVVKNKLISLVDKDDAGVISQWADSKNNTSLLDRSKLDATAKTIIDGVINGVNVGNGISKDDKEIAANLKTYLEAMPGLKDKIKSVEVYHSGTFNLYNNTATINGKEFDLDEGAPEQLNDYLLSLDRNTFKKGDQPQTQNSSGPQKGTAEDGYEFIGGDPADPKNWKKAN